ncbi:hypothetical protein NR798_00840 [Archangium gephyra]|uniref:hypothetical protein n=1 Tax=Archangium gephyra TaxID=48 RepID=UPI0035D5144F
MVKKLLLTALAGLALWGSCRLSSERKHDQFLAEKKSEFSGYRVEYLEKEKSLFLHQPNGDKDGVELAKLNKVFLWRLHAAGAVDNKTRYFWVIQNQFRSFSIPYFSMEPHAMLLLLKKELPEIDIEKSLRYADQFEHDKFDFCNIWASPEAKAVEAAERRTRPPGHLCAP